MPRDVGTGIYRYPDGTLGNPGQTIFSTRYNTFLNDLTNTLNQALPVNMGGTGATDAKTTRDNLDAEVAAQVVTNYDTHVWESGSFRSGVGATGAPTASDNFAGTALIYDTGSILLEAFSIPGPGTTPIRYIRKKYGSWEAWQNADYVNVTGDTMTGPLTIAYPTAALLLNANGGSSGSADIFLQRNGLVNWLFRSDNTSGHLYCYRMNDAGAGVDSPFVINHSDGEIGISRPMPTRDDSVASKQYVDTTTVSSTGDTMSGLLTLYAGLTVAAGSTIFNGSNRFNTAVDFYALTKVVGSSGSMIASGNHKLEVTAATGADEAYMTFHRPGAYAVNFGIGSDNMLRYGGWSAGAATYRVMHEGLGAPAFTTGNLSILSQPGTNSTLYFRDEGNNIASIFYWNRANSRQDLTVGGANYIFHSNGQAYKAGGGVWTDSSDARIKNVLGNYDNGLDAVLALQPVRFTFKGNDTSDEPSNFRAPEYEDDGTVKKSKEAVVVPYPNSPHYGAAKDGREYIGLIAQTCETAFPEMVTQYAGMIDGQPVTDMRTLDTTPLIFALVNSIKALHARIEALEAAQAPIP